MSGITLSAGVRQSLSSLQSAASQSSTIQNRLATGKKVNSALDNPSNFFTASGLNNRANDLTRLLDDMGQAVKTLQAADKGISAVTKLVENAQSVAKQAKAFKREESTLTGSSSTDLTGATTLDALGFTNGSTLTLTIEGEGGAADDVTTLTITTATAMDVDDILAAFDAADGTNVDASISGGELQLTDSKGRGLTLASSAAAGLTGLVGSSTTAAATEDKRATLQEDYDSLMTQINQLARDSSYNGVNLLDGDDLSVQFNENGSSKLDIKGTNVSAGSSGLAIDDENLDTDANIEAALKSLKTATDTLRTQSSTFGSNLSVVQNRQDFTKGMVDTLQQGADALTAADMNQEGANLLALQTRSQLAQTTLSMASQADQAVLRLF
jgi:flagellin-like hook-associated protein FlgL